MSESNKIFKVGSRKSQLAMVQTEQVIQNLKKLQPDLQAEIVSMTTVGDNRLDVALSKIGEKALFTSALEDALAKGEIEFAVHSLKDMPTTLPDNMVIAAICRREDCRDAVVLSRRQQEAKSLFDLPKRSIIGTSSLRRIAQLKRRYPNVEFSDVRGNLNTRFRKMDEDGLYDGLILAAAGVKRLGLENRITQCLDASDCMWAVGQGALAVECAENNRDVIELLSQLQHEDTLLCCLAERSLMKALEGGCSIPLAVESKLENGKLTLTGGVFSLDGSESICDTLCVQLRDEDELSQGEKVPKVRAEFTSIVSSSIPRKWMIEAESLGTKLASRMLEKGAKRLLERIRNQTSTNGEVTDMEISVKSLPAKKGNKIESVV